MRDDPWPLESTGDWSVDNRAGRSFALETVRVMRRDHAPNMLGPIVKSMIDKGVYGGPEVGFLQAIAEMASR